MAATFSSTLGAHSGVPCPALQEMFNKAKHPRRVFVAAVQQIYEFKEACWHTGLPWGEQIRTFTVPYSEAKGPTNARHQAASLYRNEDYFLQIDSHTTFIQVHAAVSAEWSSHMGWRCLASALQALWWLACMHACMHAPGRLEGVSKDVADKGSLP